MTTLVCYQNHFDLIWRRCWDRTFVHRGLTYRSYSDIEAAWCDRALELAEEKGAAFQIEQTYTLRMWLQRRPQIANRLRKLAAEDRFAVLGSGEAIIDVNMCRAETMVRNLASGARFAREVTGRLPPTASHGDGFGSSAQFPQAARGCGWRAIDGLSYLKPDAPYWRGLDGSTVLTGCDRPGALRWNDYCYYEPCLGCRGTGCAKCADTGLRLSQGAYADPIPGPDPASAPLLRYADGSEEMMPNPALPGFVEAQRKQGEDWQWRSDHAWAEHWEPNLAKVDEANLPVSSRVENNPVLTGTLVSRIRVKQAARQAEAWFYAAERLATVAGCAADAQHERAWLRLPLLFFHDAITGTHIDPAQDELLEAAAACEHDAHEIIATAAARQLPGATLPGQLSGRCSVAVFNPHPHAADLPVRLAASGGWAVRGADGQRVLVKQQGSDREPLFSSARCIGPSYRRLRDEPEPHELAFLAPAVPALSWSVLELEPAEPSALDAWEDLGAGGTASTGAWTIVWDATGVHGLARDGEELLDPTRGILAGLVLDEDIGDPWGTRAIPSQHLDLASSQTLTRAQRRDGVIEIIHDGLLNNGPFGSERDTRVFGLHWRTTISVVAGQAWCDCVVEVFWQSIDKRLRIAFPSRAATDRATYGIPGGRLDRDRYEQTGTHLWSPDGNWPALMWAATSDTPGHPSLAVIDTGTPGYRVEDGRILVSVLRSVSFGSCLNRYAQEHPLPSDGLRDDGRHVFRFAVMPGADREAVRRCGEILNLVVPTVTVPNSTKPPTAAWAIEADGVELAALKPGWVPGTTVVRLVEQSGVDRSLALRIPTGCTSAHIANNLEDTQGDPLTIHAGQIQIPMRAHGIVTIVLTGSPVG